MHETTVVPMPAEGQDKTPLMLLVAAVLWLSTLAAIVVGIRLRLRPILLVGAVDGLLALLVTLLALSGRGRR